MMLEVLISDYRSLVIAMCRLWVCIYRHYSQAEAEIMTGPLTSSGIIHPLFVTGTFRISEFISVFICYLFYPSNEIIPGSWFGFVLKPLRVGNSLFFCILWKIRCSLRGINYCRVDTATQQQPFSYHEVATEVYNKQHTHYLFQ